MTYFRPARSFCFDDVLLVPQYSEIESRKEISVGSVLDPDREFSLPIISSPMDTVTEDHMAAAMHAAGGLGVIHRYNTIAEQVDLVERAVDFGADHVAAAIGVTGDYFDRAANLVAAGCRIICVDIAHGHHSMMRYALETLRNTYGSAIHIMAGNVATLKGFNDLADWGADSIRVGIGGGSICSTRVQTGHGVPTLQSVLDCASSDRDATLIADGGIRNSGDIVKALAAGADFVMVGSLLAGSSEAPGDIVYIGGEQYKAYRGMASKDAQMNWRGHTSSVEGVSSMVPSRGPVTDVLAGLELGIRSGLSYSGCHNITELHVHSTFIRQSSAGTIESSTHIDRRA